MAMANEGDKSPQKKIFGPKSIINLNEEIKQEGNINSYSTSDVKIENDDKEDFENDNENNEIKIEDKGNRDREKIIEKEESVKDSIEKE